MKDESFDPRISRNKRRRRVWIVIVAAITITAAWIFRPHWHADESLIDPRLRALKKPYRHVASNTIFDGGSIRMDITDAAGRTEYFFIPNGWKWQSVYVMPDPKSFKGHIPASNQAATLQELAAILAEHQADWEDYHNLANMTGRLGDRIKFEAHYKWIQLKDWWDGIRF